MVGAWVPYWRLESGVACAKFNCDLLDQVSPFSLEVDHKGNLKNTLKRKLHLWQELFAECKKKGSHKLFVPTIYWTDTQQMHDILSNKARRDEHIRQIMDAVLTHRFDGININYERVCSHDREEYLLFLEKLSKELHSRGLVLFTSIGGRTGDNTIGILHPNHKEKKHGHTDLKNHAQKHRKKVHISLNPGKGEAAKHYKKVLATCCDQIHIMGYDEWGRPYKYSQENFKNKYYISHSSNQWIEQIIQYALTFIPPHKLVLGIPTYGLEFAIFHKGNCEISFKKRRNVNFPKAQAVAAQHKKQPTRTAGGELSYSYHTPDREERYVCFLDSNSVKDKIRLAKKYGIKGVYFFTINGNEDTALWPTIKREC